YVLQLRLRRAVGIRHLQVARQRGILCQRAVLAVVLVASAGHQCNGQGQRSENARNASHDGLQRLVSNGRERITDLSGRLKAVARYGMEAGRVRVSQAPYHGASISPSVHPARDEAPVKGI